MKLLFALYKYFPWGGLQKDTLRFAAEALRRGHQVNLLTTSWQGSPPPDGLRVLPMPRIHALTNTGRMDAFARHFQRLREVGNYDATFALNRLPGADFYFAADSCLKRYLSLRHSRLMLALSPRYRAILRQEAAVFGPDSRTHVFLIAEAQRTEFTEEYGISPDRLTLLPPGLDPACLPPSPDEAAAIRGQTRAALGLADGELMLLLVGTSFRRKGADRALAAIAALPPPLRNRVRFFFIGNNPPAEFNSAARRLGLPTGQATALPPREHVGELLLAADLMIHPAREEGTGTVLVEAIANALPVLCTAACGFSPYVSAAGSPVLPEPFDQDALDRALADTLPRLPDLRRAAAQYAATADFTRRAAAALDQIEQNTKR